MGNSQQIILSIVNKKFKVTYKNPFEQIDTLEGELSSTDLVGFFAFTVSGKLTLIPRDRILFMEGI